MGTNFLVAYLAKQFTKAIDLFIEQHTDSFWRRVSVGEARATSN